MDTNQVSIKLSSKTQGNVSKLSLIFITDQISPSYKYKDAEFICKDGILYGHRSILMGHCEFFRNIFLEEKNEPMTTIYLPEFEVKYFSIILSSLYSGGMLLNSFDIPEITIILEHLGVNIRESCTIKHARTEDVDFSRQELRVVDIKDEEKFNYLSEFHTFLNYKSHQKKTSQGKSGPSSSKRDQVIQQKGTSSNNIEKISPTIQTDNISTRILLPPTATMPNTPIKDANFNIPMPKLSPQAPRHSSFKCFICQKIGSTYKEFNEHLNKEECGKSLVGKFTYNESEKKCHICLAVFEKIDGDILMKHVKLCDDRITIKREVIEEREKISVSSSESESSSSSSSESDDEDALIPVLIPVKTPTPITTFNKECKLILQKLPQSITDDYKEQLLRFKNRQKNPPSSALDSDSDYDNRRRTRSSNRKKSHPEAEVISLVSDSDSENENEDHSMQTFKLTTAGPLSYKLFNCQVCSTIHKNCQAVSDCLAGHNKIQCYVCLEIFTIDILERHMSKKHSSLGSSELIECSHCLLSLQWKNMNAHIIESHYKGKTENKNYKSSTSISCSRKNKSSKKDENDPKAKIKGKDSSLASSSKQNYIQIQDRVHRNKLKSSPSISSSPSEILKRPTTASAQVSGAGGKTSRLSENIINQASSINQTSSSILTPPSKSNEYLNRPSMKTTSAFLLANKLSQSTTPNKKRKSSNSSDSSSTAPFCDLVGEPNSSCLSLEAQINPSSDAKQKLQQNVDEMGGYNLDTSIEELPNGKGFYRSIVVNNSVYRVFGTKKPKGQTPPNYPSQPPLNIHKDGDETPSKERRKTMISLVPSKSINSQAPAPIEPQIINMDEILSRNNTLSNAFHLGTQQSQSQVTESSILLEISGNKLNNNTNSSTVQAVDNNDNDNTELTNNTSRPLDVNQLDNSLLQSLLDSDSDVEDVSYRSRANYACDKCKERFINKSNYDGHVCI